jgi:DNA-binding transcriptional regulator YiaG
MKINTRKNTRKNNLQPAPSEKTRWAYWMQAIEPKSKAINKAFPEYHPQWVRMSQMMNITPEKFIFLRSALGMTKQQCAAYLRVGLRTIQLWESGSHEIPFSVFELLRVVFESAQFKLSNPEWDGWFVAKDGRLVSPDVSCSFSTGELNYLSFNQSEAAILQNEVIRLQSELDASIGENTRLRQMFFSGGMVDELAAMQEKVNNLMALIATAKVIPFPKATEQLLEKTA